jgi:hypothetical protein
VCGTSYTSKERYRGKSACTPGIELGTAECARANPLPVALQRAEALHGGLHAGDDGRGDGLGGVADV